jgi:hypothetical protein
MRTLYGLPGVSSALTAATAKTVLSVVAPASFGINWLRYEISFDGATSTAVPAKIELCTHTAAGAGTSTAATAIQVGGVVIASGVTGATNYTVEPTVLTPFDTFTLPVYGGTGIVPFTPGQEPNSVVSQGFAIRVTAPAAVNCTASLWFERA